MSYKEDIEEMKREMGQLEEELRQVKLKKEEEVKKNIKVETLVSSMFFNLGHSLTKKPRGPQSFLDKQKGLIYSSYYSY